MLGIGKAFKRFDKNKDETLDINEFKQVLKICQINFSEQDTVNLFAHLDTNSDRTIDFDEFLLFIRG